MKLHTRLKALREENNLKLKNVSLATGIPLSSISHYEVGVKRPTYENLIKLADFYHVSTDYLLCRDAKEVVVKEDLCQKIKQIRLDKKYSHRDFALYIDIKPKELELIESGNPPTFEVASKIASHLGINISDFILEPEEPQNDEDTEFRKAQVFASNRENLPYIKLMMTAKEKESLLPEDIVIGKKL